MFCPCLGGHQGQHPTARTHIQHDLIPKHLPILLKQLLIAVSLLLVGEEIVEGFEVVHCGQLQDLGVEVRFEKSRQSVFGAGKNRLYI